MTQYDIAAAALVVTFGYGGFRRGLVAFVLQVLGGVLAFALAALTAPLLVPYVARLAQAPETLVRPFAVVALSLILRAAFGIAVRELAATLGAIIRAVPPLALVDRVLGILPGMALGGLLALGVTLALLTLPAGQSLHDTAAASWLARTVIAHPEETLAWLRGLWERTVVSPPRLNALSVSLCTGAFWSLALLAYVQRTRLPAQPAPPALPPPALPDETALRTADPTALPRALLGAAAAFAIMTGLWLWIVVTGNG